MASTMTIRVNEVTAIRKAGARLMTVRPSRILTAVVTSSASPLAACVVMLTPGNSISAAAAPPATSRAKPAITSRHGHAARRSARAFILPFLAVMKPLRSGVGSQEQAQSIAVLADQQGASIELDHKESGTWRETQRFHYFQPASRGSRPRAGQVSVAADSDGSDCYHARKGEPHLGELVREARLLLVGNGAGRAPLRGILGARVPSRQADGDREQHRASEGNREQPARHGAPDLPSSTMRTPNVSPITTSCPRPISFESM